MFSLRVLIGRGLDLFKHQHAFSSLRSLLGFLLFSFEGLRELSCMRIVGTNSYEVPPVPIPNTEVKLFYVENTRLATTREDR